MNRRTFLKTSCLAVLPVLGTGCSTSVVKNGQNQRPLFTFIQLTDTHVNAPYDDQTVYACANERMQWFVDALNNGTIPKPDFIVHTGDMIHGGELEELGPDFEVFQQNVLNKLPVPFYPCVGNHENVQRSGFPEYDEAYINTFGTDKKNYTFERDGIVFVMFDNSSDPVDPPWGSLELKQHRGKMRQQRNKWLRTVLAENGKPKILCCHIPLVSLREDVVLKESFGFISWYSNDRELQNILLANNETILAVLSGHLHLSGCVKVNGIYHIVPSGLASYPHDYVVYKVYSDRIDVCMHSLPKELSQPYESDIHGSRRHGIDYTDNKHATHERYVRGNLVERAFSIPIKNQTLA